MKEVFCIAIRGRPITTEQQIEIGSKKIAFCLTTVSKDSMILEIEKCEKKQDVLNQE